MTGSRQNAAVLAVTGAVALAAEVAWVRALEAVAGEDIVAAQAVLAAFFVGFGIGAVVIGRWAERAIDASAPALATFGRLALGAGAAILLSRPALSAAERLVPRLSTGEVGMTHGFLTFAVAICACGPATAFMGASIPVLVRAVRTGLDGPRPALARLALANTAGAIVGTLGTSVFGLGRLGVARVLDVAALIELATGAVALWLARGQEAPRARTGALAPGPAPVGRVRRVVWAGGLAGFAAIAFELAALRVVGATSESTILAFGAVVAAYLVGGAAGSGAAGLGWWRGKGIRSIGLVYGAAALVVAICGVGLTAAPALRAHLHTSLGRGWGAELASDFATALLLGAPAAGMASMLFGLTAPRAAMGMPGGLRAAVAASALGSSLAPIVGGLAVAPIFGSKGLVVVATVALVAGSLVLAEPGRRSVGLALTTALLALIVAVSLPSPLASWPLPSGSHAILVREGASGLVVVEETAGHRLLRTDARYYEGGEESMFGERRQGHLPMLLHPGPRRVLVLGLGAGVTLAAVAEHPGVQVEGVELSSEVLDVLPAFSRANGDVGTRANVRLHHGDARSVVRGLAARGVAFDVVIGDLFHPQREGAALLYTREHFRSIRRVLEPGGVFVQWLPLHELSPSALAVIVATFLETFPDASGWLAYFNAHTPAFGLVAGIGPVVPSFSALELRVRASALRATLAADLLDQPLELLGGFLTGPVGLRRLAGSAETATDDRPLLDVLVSQAGPDAGAFRSLEAVLAVREASSAAVIQTADVVDRARVDGFREAVACALSGEIALGRGELEQAAALFQLGFVRAPELLLNGILLRRAAAALRRNGQPVRAGALETWLSGRVLPTAHL